MHWRGCDGTPLVLGFAAAYVGNTQGLR